MGNKQGPLGSFVQLDSDNLDLKTIKDLTNHFEMQEISNLRKDYFSFNNSFTHIQNKFLSNNKLNRSSNSEQSLFWDSDSLGNLLLIDRKGNINGVRLVKPADYLVSLLWMVALEPDSSDCFDEYIELLVKMVNIWGNQRLLHAAIFLFSLEEFESSGVKVNYEWIEAIVPKMQSQLSTLMKQSEQSLSRNLSNKSRKSNLLVLDNSHFLKLKTLIISVLKIFGGFQDNSVQVLSKALMEGVIKWKLQAKFQRGPKSPFEMIDSKVFKNQGIDTGVKDIFGVGILSTIIVRKIIFELEELSGRDFVIKEHNSSKYPKKINRESHKIRNKTLGILQFLLEDKGNPSDLEIKLNSFIEQNFTEDRVVKDRSKLPLSYKYRLNFGLAELKSLLEKVVGLQNLLSKLKQDWISNKFCKFGRKMMEAISWSQNQSSKVVTAHLEVFPKENHLSGLLRLEILAKLLVNLLILDNISPKYLNKLIALFRDAKLGDCLLSSELDSFWKQICFDLGNKFFFDKLKIYSFFFEEETRDCLNYYDSILIKLKNSKGKNGEKIRFDKKKNPSQKMRRGNSLQVLSKPKEGLSGHLVENLFKKINRVSEHLETENIMSMGKVFLLRGCPKEAAFLVRLICQKFEQLSKKEKIIVQVRSQNKQAGAPGSLRKQEILNNITIEQLKGVSDEKKQIKVFLISFILNLQNRRLSSDDENKNGSIWENLKDWTENIIEKIWKSSTPVKSDSVFDEFLNKLSNKEIESFWRESLEIILNQPNEDLRVFFLKTVLSMGKSDSLRLVEASLREEDLVRLIQDGIRLEGQSGVQNYFFLINFFDKKRNYQTAISLILKIVRCEYLKDSLKKAFQISKKEILELSEFVLRGHPGLENQLKAEKEILEKGYFVTINQKLSLLIRAKLMVNSSGQTLNKRDYSKKIRSQNQLLTFQAKILSELSDLHLKIKKIRCFKDIFKLKETCLDRLELFLEVMIKKLNIGNFSIVFLIESIVKQFNLFSSFDSFLKDGRLNPQYLENNFYENLQTGLNHFAKADSIRSCFNLENFFQLSSDQENSAPLNLLEDHSSNTDFKKIIMEKKMKVLFRLAKNNLIFPYNVFPGFLNSITAFIFSDKDEIKTIHFKNQNRELFEVETNIFHEKEIIGAVDLKNENSRELAKQKAGLILSVQKSNCRNSLINALVEISSCRNLMKEGINQEPLWFTEHLLLNLPKGKTEMEIFRLFFLSWKETKRESSSNQFPLRKTFNKRTECRLQLCCLRLVDFSLKMQTKRCDRWLLSTNTSKKNLIKSKIQDFDRLVENMRVMVASLREGETQRTLLSFSNQEYIDWAQQLSQELKKYLLSAKRARIKNN